MSFTTSGARVRRTGRASLALLAVAGLAAGLTAGASAQSPSAAALPPVEEGTFQMGIEPWIGYGPWWIADQKAISRPTAWTPWITNFNTDADINAALISGQINGANIATHTALRLASEGTPITIVLLLDQSNAADAILAGADIASVADLAGKQVAYEEGTTSDILLRYALGENGTDHRRHRAGAHGRGRGRAWPLAGQVPAAVTYEPYITTALAENPDLKAAVHRGGEAGPHRRRVRGPERLPRGAPRPGLCAAPELGRRDDRLRRGSCWRPGDHRGGRGCGGGFAQARRNGPKAT